MDPLCPSGCMGSVIGTIYSKKESQSYQSLNSHADRLMAFPSTLQVKTVPKP